MSERETKLRFISIERVSTPGQKDRISLPEQKRRNKANVEMLGGYIPEELDGQYSGQEHATPEFEHERFNQFLQDTLDDTIKYDAVMFDDYTRYNRDPVTNQKAVTILRKKNKMLYIGSMNFDLFDPHHEKFLDYGSADAKASANIMNKASMLGKINIAERGFPINGKNVRVPPGRKLLNYEDRFKQGVQAEYEIIPKVQKLAEEVAVRYIVGERLEPLSVEKGIPLTTLRRMITEHAGPKWKRSFKREIFGIDKQFETDIPELLPEGLRNAVLERVEKNRTLDRDYTNNTYFKNRYLLKGFVFCGYCDRPFYGKVLKSGDHYYYHNKPKCGHIDCIKGVRLEPPVLAEVASRFSDAEKAEAAIKFRLPDQKERNGLKAELKRTKRTISKLNREKKNYLDAIGKGLFSDELQDRAKKVEADIEASNLRKKQIHNQISQLPDPEDKMAKIALQTMQQIIRSYYRNPSRILDMSFDDKRKMLEHVFSGRDEEGKKHGIYLTRGKKRRDYIYELKWIFKFNEVGTVMMPDDMIMEMLGLDKKEYIQLFSQLQTKNHIYGKEKTGF